MILSILIPFSLLTPQVGPKFSSDEAAFIRLGSKSPIVIAEIPRLMSTLESPNPKVRQFALRFWAERGEEARSMVDRDVREGVPYARPDFERLEKFCKGVVSLVSNSLDSRDHAIRLEATRTICALGTEAKAICPPYGRCGNSWGGTFVSHTSKIDAVLKRTAPRELASLVTDSNATVAYNALALLEEPEVIALQSTIQMGLNSPDQLKRAIAIYFYRPKNDSEAIRVLGPIIEDRDETMGVCADFALSESLKDIPLAFRDRASLRVKVRYIVAQRVAALDEDATRDDMLRAFLTDSFEPIRELAIQCLVSDTVKITERQAREMLSDVSGRVRGFALTGLVKLGVSDSTDLVTKCLTGSDRNLKEAAISIASDFFNLAYTSAVVKCLETKGTDAEWSLREYFSHPLNEHLLDGWLKSKSMSIRRTAVASLTDDESDRFMPRLLRLTDETDPEILCYVVGTIGNHKGAASLTALKKVAERVTGDVLGSTLAAIAKLGDIRCLPYLNTFVNSQDETVRHAARNAISELQKAVPPPI
ncbi:MAG: hypothetical protein ABL962_05265 [Fimbriimonadaceae bacterium]